VIALQTLSGDFAFEGFKAALQALVEVFVLFVGLVLAEDASFLADFFASFRSIKINSYLTNSTHLLSQSLGLTLREFFELSPKNHHDYLSIQSEIYNKQNKINLCLNLGDGLFIIEKRFCRRSGVSMLLRNFNEVWLVFELFRRILSLINTMSLKAALLRKLPE